MKEYKGKTLEEIRLEDYQVNRKTLAYNFGPFCKFQYQNPAFGLFQFNTTKPLLFEGFSAGDDKLKPLFGFGQSKLTSTTSSTTTLGSGQFTTSTPSTITESDNSLFFSDSYSYILYVKRSIGKRIDLLI